MKATHTRFTIFSQCVAAEGVELHQFDILGGY